MPGMFSSQNQLTFEWSVEQFGPENLEIRLSFDNPNQISAWSDREQLGITINGFYLFEDYKGNMMRPESILAPRFLPRQTTLDEATRVKRASKITYNTIVAVFAAGLTICVLISGSLHHILIAHKHL